MIVPNAPLAPDAVADHYDELDVFYRELWGEHVHHGLWRTGRESADEAVAQLALHVADALHLEPGARVVDIGTGYGATARLVAERWDAEVTGLTVSAAQHAYASRQPVPRGRTRFLLRDWLASGLPDESFDAAFAIESTEHMADKAGAFAEAARVLEPGGRLAVCAWIARERARRWEVQHLLEPICREGRLPGMGTEGEYRALIEGAGFDGVRVEELSRQVKGTWPRSAARLARRVATDGRYRRFLASERSRNRVFAMTLFRIWLAYETGAMRYLLFTARKPA